MNYFVQEFSKVKFPRINKHKIKFKYMPIKKKSAPYSAIRKKCPLFYVCSLYVLSGKTFFRLPLIDLKSLLHLFCEILSKRREYCL